MIIKCISKISVKLISKFTPFLNKFPKVPRIVIGFIIGFVISFIVGGFVTLIFLVLNQFFTIFIIDGYLKKTIDVHKSIVATGKKEGEIICGPYNLQKECSEIFVRYFYRYSFEENFNLNKDNLILRFLEWQSNSRYKKIQHTVPADNLVWVYFWYLNELEFLMLRTSKNKLGVGILNLNIEKLIEGLDLFVKLTTKTKLLNEKRFVCSRKIFAHFLKSRFSYIRQNPNNLERLYNISIKLFNLSQQYKNQTGKRYLFDIKVINLLFDFMTHEYAPCNSMHFYRIKNNALDIKRSIPIITSDLHLKEGEGLFFLDQFKQGTIDMNKKYYYRCKRRLF